MSERSAIPVLVCDDIEASHDHLVATFGFEPGGFHRDPHGTVVHGEVQWGDTTFWLHRVVGDMGLLTPDMAGSATGGMSVLVDDVDEHHRRALEAGADVRREPTDQPYGLREYEARDLDGHRWWFSQPLS